MLRRLVVLAPLLTALMSSCGYPTAVTPTAKEILAKPQQSNLKDAHFTVAGSLSNSSTGTTVKVTGDGAIDYKPPGGRFKFITTVSGQVVSFEQISVNGMDYGLQTPGAAKWVSKADPTGGIGPSVFAGASAQKYIGEENLPQGKAWHASAKDSSGNPFEAYIRESDGYPIKYVETQSGGDSITLTFDHYNTGAMITPPPAAQVTPG